MSKVGVIDSGVGGLSLVKTILDLNLDTDIYYICDKENVPYGGKEQGFMLKQVMKMTEILIKNEIKDILIACNTLTVETIRELRETFNGINFVGIEPYINYLNHFDGDSKLGLILTRATFNSRRFKELQNKFDKGHDITVIPLDRLALEIESLYYSKTKNHKKIDEELNKIKNVETLILGCTHYPLISKYIKNYLGVNTIDPHKQVIDRLQKSSNIKIKSKREFIYINTKINDKFTKMSVKDLLTQLDNLC